MATPKDLERLAQAVKTRRLELGPSRLKAAQSAGMSKDTWLRVERGEPVRELNYAKIDRELKWAAGSCSLVLRGGEPVLSESAGAGTGLSIAEVSSDLEGKVAQAVQSASIAVSDSLTAAEIRELSARVVADLKQLGVL